MNYESWGMTRVLLAGFQHSSFSIPAFLLLAVLALCGLIGISGVIGKIRKFGTD